MTVSLNPNHAQHQPLVDAVLSAFPTVDRLLGKGHLLGAVAELHGVAEKFEEKATERIAEAEKLRRRADQLTAQAAEAAAHATQVHRVASILGCTAPHQ